MGIKTTKFSKTFEAGRRSILTRHSLTGHSFHKLVASGYFPDQPFSSTHVKTFKELVKGTCPQFSILLRGTTILIATKNTLTHPKMRDSLRKLLRAWKHLI